MELPIIDPQDCRGAFKEKYYDDPDWWAEHKLHGCRFLLYSDKRMLSRHNSVDGNGFVDRMNVVPHFNDPFCPLPYDTVFDGELILHEFGTVREVTSIILSLPDLAIKKQMERGYLSYRVFDTPIFMGKDIRNTPLYERRDRLENWFAGFHHPYISLLEKITKNKKSFYENILLQGGEGVILKWRGAKYGEKRYWVKDKQNDTFDVFVTGYKPAKEMSTKVSGETSITKYAALGWIGAINIGMYNQSGEVVDVGFCSGMKESLRRDISENPSKFLGQVLEIKAQTQLPTGKFENPRFIRWREDKWPDKCVWSPKEG